MQLSSNQWLKFADTIATMGLLHYCLDYSSTRNTSEMAIQTGRVLIEPRSCVRYVKCLSGVRNCNSLLLIMLVIFSALLSLLVFLDSILCCIRTILNMGVLLFANMPSVR